MKKHETPILQAARVTLRPPKPSDAKDRHALGHDAEIVRMFGGSEADIPREYSLAMAESWIAALGEHPCAWVIDHNEKIYW